MRAGLLAREPSVRVADGLGGHPKVHSSGLGVLEGLHSGSEFGVDDGMLAGDILELVAVVAQVV